MDKLKEQTLSFWIGHMVSINNNRRRERHRKTKAATVLFGLRSVHKVRNSNNSNNILNVSELFKL